MPMAMPPSTGTPTACSKQGIEQGKYTANSTLCCVEIKQT